MAPDIILDDENEWPVLLSPVAGISNPTNRQSAQTEESKISEERVGTSTVSSTSGTDWEIIVEKSLLVVSLQDVPKQDDASKKKNKNILNNDDDEWNEVSIVESERHQEGDIIKDDSYYNVDNENVDDTSKVDAVEIDSGIVNKKNVESNLNHAPNLDDEERPLRRSRGNSISSPDLRTIQQQQQHPIVITENNITNTADEFIDNDYYYDDDYDYDEEYDDCGNYSTTVQDWDDTGSFSVLSTVHPESVVSCWSMNNNSSSNTGARSFRDILLMNAKKVTEQPQQQQQQLKSHPNSPNKNRRMMSKTRFVVVPTTKAAMKRCAKSTNDIPSLLSNDSTTGRNNDDYDNNYNHDEDHNHGVEFYYSNKAMGARGRSNGLKLRPDELKRRDMIIHKKNLQRQASGVGKKR